MTRQNLIVFSDDWGRHPSSCQHLVSHLLDRFEVTWVNTIGTRPPRINIDTLRRGCEKLRHWSRPRSEPTNAVQCRPRVLNPMMWPSFRGGWQRGLNRTLLRRCLKSNISHLDDSIILTTIPITADLMGQLTAARWVYYCVDDFSQWPGLDGPTLADMEAETIDRADGIVAAGNNLADRILKRGRQPMVLTHGVDLEHWAPPAASPIRHHNLQGYERPVILFWGLIDQRLDIDWIRTLSDSMSAGSIVLAGPEQSPNARLRSLSKVHFTGPLEYDALPAAAAAADVLIMPYGDLPVTRAMQPLKLKEYLATGKPVVVRRLPATAEWDDCLDAADTADDFVAAVRRRMLSGVAHEQVIARQRLLSESWPVKSQQLTNLLLGLRNECRSCRWK